MSGPGLVVYYVYNITANADPNSPVGPPPFQIGNGRIPVFAANQLGALNITACGNYTLAPDSEYLLQYWIRDKFGQSQTQVQVAQIMTGP